MPELNMQIKQKAEELLDVGLSSPFSTHHDLQTLLLWKMDGPVTYRFRDLNEACHKDEFLLPNKDMLVDATIGHLMSSFMNDFMVMVRSRWAL